MELKSKYHKWYHQIISNPDSSATFVEVHHILPKSLGGSNDPSNLVSLSARQHFVAHLLLTKMYKGKDKKKMCWALHRMAFSSTSPRKFKSSEYEMARKIHISNLSKPKSEEHQAKISKALTGKKRTPEQKERMREAIRAERERNPNNPKRIRTQELQDEINAKLRGKPKSEETKAKLASAMKGKKLSEEHKAKISVAGKGKKLSEEHKAKISAALKKAKTKSKN